MNNNWQYVNTNMKIESAITRKTIESERIIVNRDPNQRITGMY